MIARQILTNIVFQHLEESVRSGQIQRSENKGKVTYKDPESGPRGKSKHGLKLGPSVDITKIFVKAVRELGESGGSNLRTVEKYINSCYDVELEQVMLMVIHYYTAYSYILYNNPYHDPPPPVILQILDCPVLVPVETLSKYFDIRRNVI